MTEIRLPGPVEVWADGLEVDVGSAKPRLVLAALAVAPGQVVPTAVIADAAPLGGRWSVYLNP